MIQFFRKLFSTDFMPHGYCIRIPQVIWLHQISDLVIALSYFLIPFALIYFVRKRRDVVFPWMFWLFGIFIISCGCTHLLAAYVVWHPVYRLDGLVKAITAIASFPTAILLIRLLPDILALPSPEQLRVKNQTLANEIAERRSAEEEIRRLNTSLEARVAERTEEIKRTNAGLQRANEELQQTEAALAHQLTLTRTITQNATTALFITDEAHRCVFMNPAAEALTGYSFEEIKGRDLHSVIHRMHPDRTDYPLEECPIQSALPEHLPRSGEDVFVHKDGHFIDVAFSASGVEEQSGIVGTVIEALDITERKRQEAERRSTARLLDAVLESIPVGIVIAGPSGELLRSNRASARIWGELAPRLENINQYGQLTGFWPGTNRRLGAREWPLSRAILEGEVTLDQQIEIERFGDGVRLTVELSAAPIWDEVTGRTLGGVVAALDVTERMRAEKAVRASEATLSAVVDALPVSVLIADPQGRLIRSNAAHRELWGGTQETLNWEQYGEWVGYWPNTGKRIKADEWAMARALVKGEVTRGELVECERFGRKEHRFFLNNAAPVYDGEGHIIAGVVAEMDVTEQRRAEQALRDSEARFRQLADSMPQIVWTARADGHVDYFNERWYQFTGIARGVEGEGSWVPLLHPDDVEPVRKTWQASLSQGSLFQIEARLWDGSESRWRWYIARALPIRDADTGQITRWFGTSTDIDSQKRVEAELRRANRDLEQFAYSASHDLQEPLRNVSIYSQLLGQRYGSQLPEQALVYLGFLTEGAQRISRLVSDLLQYTRAASLDTDPVVPANSEEVLEEVLQDLQPSIEEAHAKVLNDPLPVVGVKAIHLRQLFQNLIGNSLKYRKESEPPRVHISATQAGSLWRFAIQDNGIGIEPQYHDRIFGMFKRLHGPGGRYSGTGIGLAICQKIVERYGGRIWVESQFGSGATFYFLVPNQFVEISNNEGSSLLAENPS